MNDLISRQAAIDAMENTDWYHINKDGQLTHGANSSEDEPLYKAEDVYKVLNDMPSVPPNLQPTCNNLATDAISRQAAIDALEKWESESTWDEWCYDHKDEAEKYSVISPSSVVSGLPSAQPERTCVNCGRTLNNGGWYADGGTRCPIEEHYALPKDGYCHLWEKRNVTDDDYPERRTDE